MEVKKGKEKWKIKRRRYFTRCNLRGLTVSPFVCHVVYGVSSVCVRLSDFFSVFFLLSPFLCAPSSVLVHWCPTILPVCLFFFLAVHALPVCLYVCLYICTSTSSVCHFALVVCPLCVRWRRNGTKPDVTPFFFLRIDSAAAVGIKYETGKTRGKISSFPHRVLNATKKKWIVCSHFGDTSILAYFARFFSSLGPDGQPGEKFLGIFFYFAIAFRLVCPLGSWVPVPVSLSVLQSVWFELPGAYVFLLFF